MVNLKNKINTYHLSVEGDTEYWYFNRLEKLINQSDRKKCPVRLLPKVQKSPKKYMKSLSFRDRSLKYYHICDRESNEIGHETALFRVLDEIKEAKKTFSLRNYDLGYSNYSFELWIILHKIDCFGGLIHRDLYLKKINEAYDKKFESIDEYKEKDTFNSILEAIEIDDVICAISRAKNIKQHHIDVGHHLSEYKGFKWYCDNPDLTIHSCVELILKECGII